MEAMDSIGIYIDIDNIERSLKEYNETGLYLDFQRLIVLLSKGCRLAVLKGYGGYIHSDTGRHGIESELESIGVELVLYRCQKEIDYCKPIIRQKEVDTAITTDVSWDLATGRINRAIIMSGDRDMRPALVRAEDEGYEVKILAVKSAISDDCYDDSDLMLIDDFEVFAVNSVAEEEPETGTNMADRREEVRV
jgi:uncharacterized LabA/DUF88 family protein